METWRDRYSGMEEMAKRTWIKVSMNMFILALRILIQ